MHGGAGNDTYVVDRAGDVAIEGSSGGIDHVRSMVNDVYIVESAGPDGDVVNEAVNGGLDLIESFIDFSLVTTLQVENLTLVGSAATGTGNGLDNRITGNGENNVISGNDGNDVLIGLGGGDNLSGGDGADIFSYRSVADSPVQTVAGPTVTDLIADFTRTQSDLIDLREIDADAGTSVNDAFRFIGETPFTGSPGELRFEIQRIPVVGNFTFVRGDIDGNGAADFAIGFLGEIAFTAGSFVL
jgi:Ca2+-binding RTX toxin-like protein